MTTSNAITINPATGSVGLLPSGNRLGGVTQGAAAGELLTADLANNYLFVGNGSNVAAAVAATGTGSPVLASSPTITTPTISGTAVVSAFRPLVNSTTALQLQNAAGTSIVTVDASNARVGVNCTPVDTFEISAALPLMYITATSNYSGFVFRNNGGATKNFTLVATNSGLGSFRGQLISFANYDGTATTFTVDPPNARAWVNGNCGFGTATSPSAPVHAVKSGEQARLGDSTTNYTSFTQSAGTMAIGITTTGTALVSFSNPVAIGGGSKIAKTLFASATLDFPSTNAQSSSTLTITVTGAADGDCVALGVPSGSTNANSCFTATVTAANTVTVKFNNYSAAAIDPASGTFKVFVFQG